MVDQPTWNTFFSIFCGSNIWKIHIETRQIQFVLAYFLENTRKRLQKITRGLKFVNFFSACTQNRGWEVEGGGLFGTASDWQMQSDLNGRKQFSLQIAATNQIHDIVKVFGLPRAI